MRQTPPGERKMEISTAGNGDGQLRLSVRDHGTGISPTEVRERLFDQFFTTKEHGLGMGLAIVRSIVEAHAGKIDAENVADGGTCFYFTLPMVKPARLRTVLTWCDLQLDGQYSFDRSNVPCSPLNHCGY